MYKTFIIIQNHWKNFFLEITGNESADREANEATYMPQINLIRITYIES